MPRKGYQEAITEGEKQEAGGEGYKMGREMH